MTETNTSIPYAGIHTKPPRPTPRLGAGLAMGVVGLGLILLSGCFLIGVLYAISSTTSRGINDERWTLEIVLYIFSIISFLAGLIVTLQATRSLWHTMNS